MFMPKRPLQVVRHNGLGSGELQRKLFAVPVQSRNLNEQSYNTC